jgi:subfamily B ATP-binding cassette protein MsbA
MTQDKYSAKTLILRLLQDYVKQHILQILFAMLFMVLVAICNAIHIQMIVPAIDDVLTKHSSNILYLLSSVILIIAILKAFGEYMQAFLVHNIGQRILADIQIDLYNHLLKSDLATINELASSKIISRFTNDIALMRYAITNLALGTTKHLFSVLAIIFIMYELDAKMTFYCISVFPVSLYPLIIIGRKIRNLSYKTQEELGNYTFKLDENFSNLKIIKSYVSEEYEAKKVKSLIEHLFSLYKNLNRLDSLNSPIVEFASGIFMAFIFVYGGGKVIAGELTTGTFFAFLTAFISAYRPFKSLVRLNINIQEVFTATKRIYQLLDTKPQIYTLENAKKLIIKENSKIRFEKVSLEFASRGALSEISFEIESNKTTAIVGMFGSGKTSVANLMVRFYDPSSGNIYIDDINLKELDLSSLRSQISFVTQDNIIFDCDIAKNIAYGKMNATQEEIVAAAQKAGIDDFISKLPEGYKTIIGSSGEDLSGSQKQLIAIARALIKDAEILILDEATSALDQKTENQITKTMKVLRKNKTNIIIAHRLMSIADADKIIVMNNGAIVEEGTHNELIKNRGHYYMLSLNGSFAENS